MDIIWATVDISCCVTRKCWILSEQQLIFFFCFTQKCSILFEQQLIFVSVLLEKVEYYLSNSWYFFCVTRKFWILTEQQLIFFLWYLRVLDIIWATVDIFSVLLENVGYYLSNHWYFFSVLRENVGYYLSSSWYFFLCYKKMLDILWATVDISCCVTKECWILSEEELVFFCVTR